jgi:hypothetical protein
MNDKIIDDMIIHDMIIHDMIMRIFENENYRKIDTQRKAKAFRKTKVFVQKLMDKYGKLVPEKCMM